jgi:hypothetical protein
LPLADPRGFVPSRDSNGAVADRSPHTRESGYALLLVFLMAAVIAISLYSEIPRVAFQSQRQKEQLLMERGLQYMRAIQVYQQVNKGLWPRNLDDIETFQTRHFLRHKYIDPMTGKAEWRLIHIQGGVLTDSLVTTSPATDKQSASSGSSYISEYAGIGQTASADQLQRPQDRRRTSEGGGAGAGDVLPMMPGAGPDQSGQPQDLPISGAAPDNPANPVAGNPTQAAPGMPGMPGTTPQGQTDPSGSFQMPTQNGMGQPAPGPPGLPGQTGNPALGMINRILTSPNPQAAQIVQGTQPGGISGSGASATIGGGLAGVASKSEWEGIMVYNTQTLYKKWEFVFDPTKVPRLPGSSGVPGTPVNQMGAQQAQMPAAPGMPVGFGTPGGMGMAGGIGTAGVTATAGGTGSFGGLGMSAGLAQGAQTGTGAQGNGVAGGTPNSPAGMQAGGGAGALPPGFRMGRP